MKTLKDFDTSIEEMIKADAIRASLVPGASKSFYLVEEPWTLLEEPWRCQWFDKGLKAVCAVNTIGVPYAGEKYSLFVTADEHSSVKNYVFLMDKYHFIEE